MPSASIKNKLRGIQGRAHERLLQFLPARDVRLREILVGQQAGIPSQAWFRATGDRTRFSMRLEESPYVEFLREADATPALLDDEDALCRTSYYRMAEVCRRQSGTFFDATNAAGIHGWMRRYYEMSKKYDPGFRPKHRLGTGHSQSSTWPCVKKILDSECYEAVDGHHRLAIQLARGADEARVIVTGKKRTFLQEALLRVDQAHGVELYQPVPYPEVVTWRLVRRCEDRFAMMKQFLEERRLGSDDDRVLDCGCSYGWFLHRFKQLGCKVLGVDRDPNATAIGQWAYGLEPGNFVNQPLEGFLATDESQYDVVLFLSLLHHYALGKEVGTPEVILRKLSRITRKVLFLDTGQASEDWYRRSLRGWEADDTRRFLQEHGGFKEVVALGLDSDNVGKYKDHYRRTLFACLKQ